MEKILINLNPVSNIIHRSDINPENIQQIDKINVDDISYSEFYYNYMINNVPVIFTQISNNWLCCKQWLTTIEQGSSTTSSSSSATTLNFDNLKQEIRNCYVPIINCSKRYFNSHEKTEINFYDFLDYWKNKITNDKINEQILISQLENFNNNKINNDDIYLKDWHLKSIMPKYDFYDVPKYFASDWLNEYLIDNGKDDYRFVYMGPKGTWTPFHQDVFSSFSWSTNIYGQKKWILLPPGEELKLKDQLNNLPFSIDNQQLLIDNNVRYFIIIQKENESIFIPSNWYHQVWNITDTISINHNWFNSCNIDKIWYNLADNMRKVIKEIEDCIAMDNFNEHCQIMLRASYGMNYYDFIELLEYIEKKSLLAIFQSKTQHWNIDDCEDINREYDLHQQQHQQQQQHGSELDETIKFDIYKLNSEHFYVDLRAIRRVVKLMKIDEIIRDNMELLNKCLHLENETHLFDGVVCEKRIIRN